MDSTVDATLAVNNTLFNHLLQVISSPDFLARRGLGNEVPFFICPFRPEQANLMQEHVKGLCNQLALKGVAVLEINLYDLVLELLEARGLLERILKVEPTVSKDELLELLQGVLDPQEHIAPAIATKMAAGHFDVLFLTGAGEVYPYLRSHTILNNLQSIATDQPTVLFFPGEYAQSPTSGASLELFGRLRDDRYYRAFNIRQVRA